MARNGIHPLSRAGLRKLDPEVYRMAAASIEAGTTYSCIAIDGACSRGRGDYLTHVDAYKRLFGPYNEQDGLYLGDGIAEKHPYWDKAPTKQRSDHRVTSLLMMAEIVRAARK